MSGAPGLLIRPSGTADGRAGLYGMPNKPPPADPTKPMTPKAVDGGVVVKDPPEAAMDLTADAAEISGIRLIDAADKARKRF
jgi:hypothetical protein